MNLSKQASNVKGSKAMREAAKTKYNSGKKWRNSEITASKVGEKTFDSEMSRVEQFEG